MRLKPAVWLIISFIVVVGATNSFAHGGHGDPKWFGTALHYLIEAEHVPLSISAIFVVAIGLERFFSRRRRRIVESIQSLGGNPK